MMLKLRALSVAATDKYTRHDAEWHMLSRARHVAGTTNLPFSHRTHDEPFAQKKTEHMKKNK